MNVRGLSGDEQLKLYEQALTTQLPETKEKIEALRKRGFKDVALTEVIYRGEKHLEVTFKASAGGKLGRAAHVAAAATPIIWLAATKSVEARDIIRKAAKGDLERKVYLKLTEPNPDFRPAGFIEDAKLPKATGKTTITRVSKEQGGSPILVPKSQQKKLPLQYREMGGVGVDERGHLVDDEGELVRAKFALGYNPRDSLSIKEFVEKKLENDKTCVKGWEGHEYYIEKTRKGVSSFLFAPGGDWSKACSLRVDEAKTGGKVEDSGELSRFIHTYCELYDSIGTGREKTIGDLIAKLREKYPMTSLSMFKKDDQKKYEKFLQEIAERSVNSAKLVIDAKYQRVRLVPAEHDPNRDLSKSTFGTKIEVDKKKWEAIDRLHGKDKERRAQEPTTPYADKPSEVKNKEGDDSEADVGRDD